MSTIVKAPNPVLAQKAKKVVKIDSNIKKFLEEMKTSLLTAADPIGVGLAAPQVGKSLQIFITKPTLESPISVFINPKITLTDEQPVKKAKKTKSKKLEGCLSLPNIWGEVKRNPSLQITFLDENGKKRTKKFKGFMATIIQHEVDHLNGVLFPKRVLEQKGALYKSEKNEKGEEIFDEIKI
ncbi:peptide deformylase [Patescibacteria group bacterium]|nr:peptide deformylase [Patescibacteria group bacterium]